MYRKPKIREIDRSLFRGFIRRQVVTDCWRREGDKWVIKSDPFIDDWSEEDYAFLITCLKNTLSSGGFVYGAFEQNVLKGFVSVEPKLMVGGYLDLSSIHVSEDMRGQGIGKALFRAAADWAKAHGAKRLYISSHSAAESQAFYKAMGCVDAEICNKEHSEAEPFDRQLEYKLK
ncbi:MAG: GNAT family N-acetyltransferase [Oscillospiraceae bacterium]|nr:GNAT family N-acetyltransferase [Oscillospiraceae bacterium]